MSYELVSTRVGCKDVKKLKGTTLAKKAKALLEMIQEDSFTDPPPFEALVGDVKGAYSLRINIQRRLIYEVLGSENIINILRLWMHYI